MLVQCDSSFQAYSCVLMCFSATLKPRPLIETHTSGPGIHSKVMTAVYDPGAGYYFVHRGYCPSLRGNPFVQRGYCPSPRGNPFVHRGYCPSTRGNHFIHRGYCPSPRGNHFVHQGYCPSPRLFNLFRINGP